MSQEPSPQAMLQRRDTAIVLDREGRFWHDGEPIRHEGMIRAFRRWLTRHPDGRFCLQATPEHWGYVTVEGPAIWIEEIAVDGDRLEVGLWDGTRDILSPATLQLAPDGVLEAEIRGLPARFGRHAQFQLGSRLVQEDDGGWVLPLPGGRWRVAQRGGGNE